MCACYAAHCFFSVLLPAYSGVLCCGVLVQGIPGFSAEYFLELREFDVPYVTRYMIDSGVRCGLWFTVRVQASRHPRAAACGAGRAGVE